MHTYRISPLDLLFFRDGRPLDVDKSRDDHRNIGHGAIWPRPDHLYNAVMHALIGSRSVGERASYGQFGGVQTAGPFPLLKNPDGAETLFLPRPLDWDCVMERIPAGSTDAPQFLEYGFVDRTPEKKSYPAWISQMDYICYLAGGDRSGPDSTRLSIFASAMAPRCGRKQTPVRTASQSPRSCIWAGKDSWLILTATIRFPRLRINSQFPRSMRVMDRSMFAGRCSHPRCSCGLDGCRAGVAIRPRTKRRVSQKELSCSRTAGACPSSLLALGNLLSSLDTIL